MLGRTLLASLSATGLVILAGGAHAQTGTTPQPNSGQPIQIPANAPTGQPQRGKPSNSMLDTAVIYSICKGLNNGTLTRKDVPISNSNYQALLPICAGLNDNKLDPAEYKQLKSNLQQVQGQVNRSLIGKFKQPNLGIEDADDIDNLDYMITGQPEAEPIPGSYPYGY